MDLFKPCKKRKYFKLGKKRKLSIQRGILNTLQNTTSPVLVLDLDYLACILTKKMSSKASFLKIWKDDNILELIKNKSFSDSVINNKLLSHYVNFLSGACSICHPKYIIAFKHTSKRKKYRKDILESLEYFYNQYGIITYDAQDSLASALYTLKSTILEHKHTAVFTNDVLSWSCCVPNSKSISFISYTPENRCVYITDSTVLDYISNHIESNKLINQLRLGLLKYVGLRYTAGLLLFVEFLNSKQTDFQFNETEFNNFYGSSGQGLSQLIQAHKYLSYLFLTKPELMQLFFFGNAEALNLHVTRLLKLLDSDRLMLVRFQAFVKGKYSIKLQTNLSIELKSLSLKTIPTSLIKKHPFTQLHPFLPRLLKQHAKQTKHLFISSCTTPQNVSRSFLRQALLYTDVMTVKQCLSYLPKFYNADSFRKNYIKNKLLRRKKYLFIGVRTTPKYTIIDNEAQSTITETSPVDMYLAQLMKSYSL